ncbi:MAG TPA: hypothetical protein VGH27_06470, partial [Streptosporangiaceae bacterium]
MQVILGVAVVGAVPFTVGVVGWITGFCMGMVDHGRWHAWAQTGQWLMLAGAACGLVLLLLAVLWRGRPSSSGYPGLAGLAGLAAVAEPDLTPLAAPEHQQYLAEPPPEPEYPPELEYPQYSPGLEYPPGYYPPGEYLSAPVPSAPVPSAPVPSAPVPSAPVPSAPVPSAPVPSAPVPSAPVP